MTAPHNPCSMYIRSGLLFLSYQASSFSDANQPQRILIITVHTFPRQNRHPTAQLTNQSSVDPFHQHTLVNFQFVPHDTHPGRSDAATWNRRRKNILSNEVIVEKNTREEKEEGLNNRVAIQIIDADEDNCQSFSSSPVSIIADFSHW